MGDLTVSAAPRSRKVWPVAVAALAIAGLSVSHIGCGPSQAARSAATAVDVDLRSLGEERAMSTILDLLIEEGIATTRSWQVDRGREAPLDVDLRLQGGDFGILWVSPQDRSDHGEALPEPLENGRLLILPGADAHAAARILLLDHESYRYTSEREHVQGGAPSAGDAEARLRQDIRDFLTLARGQGGL